MKAISTLTFAALAAIGNLPGAAMGQSTVTVFGIADAALTYGRGSVANKTQLTSGSLSGSRLGFRGTEDLGGGLKASFWLEGGVNIDTGGGVNTNSNNQASGVGGGGGLTFNRTSFVGLSGTWGEVRLGRDYTPTFNGQVYYDPAFLTGVMTSQTAIGSLTIFAPNAPGVAFAGARSSNSIGYFSPDMAGFRLQLMWASGENLSNTGAAKDDGGYVGGRLSYANGPLDLSLAAARMKLSTVKDVTELVLGAAYTIGSAKLFGIYLQDNSGSSLDVKAAMLGASYQVDLLQLKASASRSSARSATGAAAGTTTKLAVGAVYSLSKRSSLYASLAAVRNRDGASAMPNFNIAANGPNGSSQGMDIGLRHIF